MSPKPHGTGGLSDCSDFGGGRWGPWPAFAVCRVLIPVLSPDIALHEREGCALRCPADRQRTVEEWRGWAPVRPTDQTAREHAAEPRYSPVSSLTPRELFSAYSDASPSHPAR